MICNKYILWNQSRQIIELVSFWITVKSIFYNSNMNSEPGGNLQLSSLKNQFVEPKAVNNQIQFKDLAKYVVISELKQPVKINFKERNVTVQNVCNLTLRYLSYF